jgi:hypothetical protein
MVVLLFAIGPEQEKKPLGEPAEGRTGRRRALFTSGRRNSLRQARNFVRHYDAKTNRVAVDRWKIDALMLEKPSVTQVTVTFFLQGKCTWEYIPSWGTLNLLCN